MQHIFLNSLIFLNILTSLCHISLLQVCLHIYSVLNGKTILFTHGLICPRLWLAQPVGIDRPYYCTTPAWPVSPSWLKGREFITWPIFPHVFDLCHEHLSGCSSSSTSAACLYRPSRETGICFNSLVCKAI